MNRSFHALWVLLAITAGLVPALGVGGRAIMPLGAVRLERASGCSATVLPDWRFTALKLPPQEDGESYADTCGLDRATGEVYLPSAEAAEASPESFNLEEELEFQAWLDWYEAQSEEPVSAESNVAEEEEEFEAYDQAYHSESEQCPRGSYCPRSARKHVDSDSLFAAPYPNRYDDAPLAADWDCGLFVAPADRTNASETVLGAFDLEASIAWTRTLLQLAQRELFDGAFAYDHSLPAMDDSFSAAAPLGEAAFFEIPTVELTLALGERPLPIWLSDYSWDAIARRDALLAEQRAANARNAIESAYAAAENAAAESEDAPGHASPIVAGPSLPPSPEPSRVAYLGEYERNFIPPLNVDVHGLEAINTEANDESDWLDDALRTESQRESESKRDPDWLYRMYRGIREIYRNIDQTLPVVPSPDRVDELLGDLRREANRLSRAQLHGENGVPLAYFVPDAIEPAPQQPISVSTTADDRYPQQAHEADVLLESGFAVESTVRAARREASVRLQLMSQWCRSLAEAIAQETPAPHAAARRADHDSAR